MTNDLEKLLNQVSVPVKELLKDRSAFKFLNIKKFGTREFRIKFLKVSGVVILSLFLILFFAGSGTGALKIQKSEDVKTGNKIVDQVSRLIVLPDEMPAIATIAKAELLKNNPFFNGADNGDQVLLFEKAGKAILYDPVLNKILNVGTVKEAGIK